MELAGKPWFGSNSGVIQGRSQLPPTVTPHEALVADVGNKIDSALAPAPARAQAPAHGPGPDPGPELGSGPGSMYRILLPNRVPVARHRPIFAHNEAYGLQEAL